MRVPPLGILALQHVCRGKPQRIGPRPPAHKRLGSLLEPELHRGITHHFFDACLIHRELRQMLFGRNMRRNPLKARIRGGGQETRRRNEVMTENDNNIRRDLGLGIRSASNCAAYFPSARRLWALLVPKDCAQGSRQPERILLMAMANVPRSDHWVSINQMT
jgi:hypothetical protein